MAADPRLAGLVESSMNSASSRALDCFRERAGLQTNHETLNLRALKNACNRVRTMWEVQVLVIPVVSVA